MVELKNINKIFRTEDIETTALNQVSFLVEKGDFVSIMGPSGCGKSTLLNILGLLDSPSDGEYNFLGEEISKYSERKLADIRKQNIGFVFQNFNLIDELTVYENVELPLLYQKVPPADRKEKVDAMLKRMGIDHRSGHFPQQLSGGQQQRVAVARALITDPKVILADEPTGNLDSEHGDEVMRLLKELNNTGTTIIMVTHSPAYAEYGNRIIKLMDGKVIQNGNNGSFKV